jgi:hypothetical protein
MQLATAEADAETAKQSLRETGRQAIGDGTLASSQGEELSRPQTENQSLAAELEGLHTEVARHKRENGAPESATASNVDREGSKPMLLDAGTNSWLIVKIGHTYIEPGYMLGAYGGISE